MMFFESLTLFNIRQIILKTLSILAKNMLSGMIEYILQYILYGKELQIELEKECTIKWFVIELGEQKPDKDID